MKSEHAFVLVMVIVIVAYGLAFGCTAIPNKSTTPEAPPSVHSDFSYRDHNNESGSNVREIKIEGCYYLLYGDTIIHKANCPNHSGSNNAFPIKLGEAW